LLEVRSSEFSLAQQEHKHTHTFHTLSRRPHTPGLELTAQQDSTPWPWHYQLAALINQYERRPVCVDMYRRLCVFLVSRVLCMSWLRGFLNMSGHIHVLKTKRVHILIHTGPWYILNVWWCSWQTSVLKGAIEFPSS